MATLTVRALDDGVRDKLRRRAAEHGHSMEAEVRAILEAAVAEPAGRYGLASRIIARMEGIDASDFEVPPRTDMPRAADFG